ncbi:zinc-binding dehydrogenase [Kribbella sp. NPDC026596]|uniref:zinc-binding dehydrogenase n=1 Tax=Kribbella sp. NPDC026596 TaxID=3155122 RepID=UPI0033EC3600
MIEPLAVAYRGLQRLSPNSGRPVAIVGAGTIGLLCAMTARALGTDGVVMVERCEARREFAVSLGFDVTVYSGERYRHVIDTTGTTSGTAAALDLTADGGRVVILGLCGQPTAPLDIDSLVLRDLTLIGSLGSPGVWPHAIELVATRQVQPSALISHHYTLAQAPDAFTLAAAATPTTRKVVLNPQQDP